MIVLFHEGVKKKEEALSDKQIINDQDGSRWQLCISRSAISGHTIGFMKRPAPTLAASDPATGCR
jgi:hypothetical protein